MTDPLADEARRLRTVEGLAAREIGRLLGVGKDRLYELLRGVPAPAWTRRPTAKDELRSSALRLRAEGWSVPEIATELAVAKSTAYLWVRHLPLDNDSPQAKERREAAQDLRRARTIQRRQSKDAAEGAARARAAAWVGRPDDRELLLLGAVLYWSEGTKGKPHRKQYELHLINSDPRLIEIFLRFVELVGMSRQELRYRLSIHETADVDASARWWGERLGIDSDRFQKPLIKRHKPLTSRMNTGPDYHGCMTVRVPRARELYVWIEGVLDGLAAGSQL
ncbi:helix-turn-helix domain-containing protein [Polymorphospora rubra]|uniref:Resolvase n=1 Tax=Polymorphospora rubra TaxID=338584 RepID=A0A810MYU8_9ACTN|nr:helix-turn-helix domain-containing protein [Polymorphospora rubra]BCJ66282.1 hypothetical protein Prubr_33030 [Polymorphospora rubra]